MQLGLPFLNGVAGKKRNQMISIDLGSRTTKAALVERRGDSFILTRYALLDAPIFEKTLSPELLSEHLKAVCQALEAKSKFVTLAVGVNDVIVRPVEMPPIPVDEMRQILKNNTRNYLQQDLPNRVFDCYIMPSKSSPKPEEPGKAAVMPKLKVLVAGAKRELLEDFQTAIRSAGLVADHIVPGLIGPVNAFEMVMPEAFAKETVALVDIGFKNSSICILQQGELVLSRVVGIGGDKVTAGLAEAMNISYAEAEGIKIGMAPEIESTLELQILPLGKELRALLDFYEHQQDRPVSHVYVSGGSARSELILQMLHSELVVECKSWNPATFLKMALTGQQAGEIEHVAPQLTVAIGAAMAAL